MQSGLNLSYSAMFDAAHAALLHFGVTANPRELRRHQTLISLFGLHLVVPGILPKDLGKSLNRAEELRLLADYTENQVDAKTAQWLVEQSEAFVADVGERLERRAP